MIEYPNGPNIPRTSLPFSPVTKIGRILFLSGQASVDDSGQIIRDTFEGEMRRALENLRRILEDAGSGLHLIVQTRNYIREAADLAEFNKIYGEYFTSPYPARTTITNCLPATLKYEVECIAIVAGSADEDQLSKVGNNGSVL